MLRSECDNVPAARIHGRMKTSRSVPNRDTVWCDRWADDRFLCVAGDIVGPDLGRVDHECTGSQFS